MYRCRGGWLDKDHPLRVRESTPVSVYGPHHRTALTTMEEPSIRRAPLLSPIRSGPAAHPRIPAREVRIGDYLDSGGRGHPYPVLRAGHHFLHRVQLMVYCLPGVMVGTTRLPRCSGAAGRGDPRIRGESDMRALLPHRGTDAGTGFAGVLDLQRRCCPLLDTD